MGRTPQSAWGFGVVPFIYETRRLDKLISFLLISLHINSMPAANSEAVQ